MDWHFIAMFRYQAVARTSVRYLSSALADIDASKLNIQLTTNPRPKVPNKHLVFGHTFTDHMLEIDWDSKSGWKTPVISPYHALSLDPAVSSLHYALQAFEGMKAYLDNESQIRLFRPDMNMARLLISSKKICFPVFSLFLMMPSLI